MCCPQFGQDLQLREERERGFLIIRVKERQLVAANAPIFQAHLFQRIAAGNEQIVLDLTQVEKIDRDGIEAMKTALQAVGTSGDLVLCGISEPVMETLRETLMNRFFGIFLGPDEAIAALA